MNESQVYFHLLVFIVTMLLESYWNVVQLSPQVIDANKNLDLSKKNWKVIIQTHCEFKIMNKDN